MTIRKYVKIFTYTEENDVILASYPRIGQDISLAFFYATSFNIIV